MLSFPINYKKPSLLDFVVDYIFDCGDIEHWDKYNLGEWVVEDIMEADPCFELSDAEYAIFCAALDNFFKEKWCDVIEKEIADRVESAKEIRDARDSAINNN